MPRQIQQYQIKPDYLEAIQVTSDNLQLIADWCGGEVEDGGVSVPTLKGVYPAQVGNYVTKNSQGRFWIYEKTQFEDKYQKVGVRGGLEQSNIVINMTSPGPPVIPPGFPGSIVGRNQNVRDQYRR